MKVVSEGEPLQKYEPAFKWVNREWVCQECGAIVILESSDNARMPIGWETKVIAPCPTCMSREIFRLRHLSRWQRFKLKFWVLD